MAPAASAGSVPEDWRERFIAAYDDEIRAWIKAAAAGGATGPSAWDGYAATVVTEAGLAALGNGTRTPVGDAGEAGALRLSSGRHRSKQDQRGRRKRVGA